MPGTKELSVCISGMHLVKRLAGAAVWFYILREGTMTYFGKIRDFFFFFLHRAVAGWLLVGFRKNCSGLGRRQIQENW